MPRQTKAAPKKPAAPPDARAAYLQIEPELATVAKGELATINTDIAQSVSIVLGVLRGSRRFGGRSWRDCRSIE